MGWMSKIHGIRDRMSKIVGGKFLRNKGKKPKTVPYLLTRSRSFWGGEVHRDEESSGGVGCGRPCAASNLSVLLPLLTKKHTAMPPLIFSSAGAIEQEPASAPSQFTRETNA